MQPTPPQDVGENHWNFPEAHDWDPNDDVVCIGGDLSPATIIDAYKHGMFPMYLDHQQSVLGWWSPVERGILELNKLRVTRSMRQSARKLRTTFNQAFRDVMIACSNSHDEGNWITEEFIEAYCRLHDLGWAHSVEVWQDDQLVGGLYGIRVDGFFAGESMFHRRRDASKVALMALVGAMQMAGMTLLDTQWWTEHLQSLGATELPRRDYLKRLELALTPAGDTPSNIVKTT